MKSMVSSLALTLLLQGQGCSFDRPDQIKNDAERELHKYFPRAVVMASPERQAIFGFTCANLGESAIAALKPLVDQSPAVQQLRQAIQRADITETYRMFALGFDGQVIRLDPNSGRTEVVPASELADYKNLYAQYCGSQQAVVGSPRRPGAGYIWMGVFEISAEWSDGFKRTFVSKDTLGLYTEGDFDLVREEEIKHREQLIRWFLGGQDVKVISIELKSIEKIPNSETTR